MTTLNTNLSTKRELKKELEQTNKESCYALTLIIERIFD